MKDLAQQKCKPCEGGAEPLRIEQARQLLSAIDSAWSLCDDGRSIVREFKFPAFSRTMGFVNAIAWVATTEGHHPDMRVSYGTCEVLYTTHAIDGLSDNDFICAAKIDRLAADM